MKVTVAGLLVLFAAAVAVGQGFDDETRMAIRLWAPEDIEEFAREIATGREFVTRDGWFKPVNEEIMMRRVAYGALKYWPDARQAVQQHTAGAGFGTQLYGKDLLRAFWIQWKPAWNRVWQQSVDVSDLDVVKRRIEEFEKKWGRWDSEDPPHKIPPGYLPEETDGIWYMTINAAQDVLIQAVLEKRGGLLGVWNNENTRVISDYAAKRDKAAGPALDPVLFYLHPANNKMKMTTKFHFEQRDAAMFKSKGYVDVTWAPSATWTTERTKLNLETIYPHLDLNNFKWRYLPVKISAVKFNEWDVTYDRARSRQQMSEEEVGKEMRGWAGPYDPR